MQAKVLSGKCLKHQVAGFREIPFICPCWYPKTMRLNLKGLFSSSPESNNKTSHLGGMECFPRVIPGTGTQKPRHIVFHISPEIDPEGRYTAF